MKPGPQLRLTLDEEARLDDERERSRLFADDLDEQIEHAMKRWEAVLDGVDPHKEIAERLGVRTTVCYDWLARRDGRRPPACLIAILFEADEVFAGWWCDRLGYERPARRIEMPAEERLRLAVAALREFGAAGEDKIRRLQLAPREGK